MVRQVTAFSNSSVKLLRSLRDKKARRAEGLFLAEGLRILTEARDSGRLPEMVAFSAEGAKHPLAAEIIAATEAAGGDAIETTPDILSKMSGKDNPQMLLGAYRQPDTSLDRIDRSKARLWMVVQALRDLHDAGTDIITITQYLRPTPRHLPVARWVKPQEFVGFREAAERIGFLGVLAGPLVRSSYRAGRLWAQSMMSKGRPIPDNLAHVAASAEAGFAQAV